MRDHRGQRARRSWSRADFRTLSAHAPEQQTPPFLRVLLATGVGCFIIAIAAILMQHGAHAIVLSAIGFAFAALGIYGLRLERVPKQRTMLGHCPACLYDLTTIPADPDGCTQCPECAAAWRLPSVPDLSD